MQRKENIIRWVSWKSLCMFLMLTALIVLSGIGGKDAYAFNEKDREDPLYWRYYDEEGNPKISSDQGKDGDRFSSEAMMGSTNVTEGKIISPYTSKTYTTRNGKIANGIDVSKYNKDVDYKKVKEAGIDYVWIRCGYRGYGTSGSLEVDPYYEQNIKNALDAGLKVGVYIYSQAINKTEAIEEADFCLSLLGDNLFKLKLPIIMDVEYIDNKDNPGRLKKANLSTTEQTNLIIAFAQRIEEKGSKAGAYMSFSWANTAGDYKVNTTSLEKNGVWLWLARYNTYLGYSDTDYMGWQYSDGGIVTGCEGNKVTDVNFIYEDSLPDMVLDDSLCNFQPYGVPENVKATAGSSKITVSWKQQEAAYGYVVMKKKSTAKSWSRLATIWNPEITSIEDKSTSSGNIYEYKISSILSADGLERSDYSTEVYCTKKAAAPYIGFKSQAASTASSKSVSLNWDPVKDASYYRVYRKVDDGEFESYAKVTGLTYEDTDVEYGGTYSYKVRAFQIMPDGSKVSSLYSAVLERKVIPAAPKMLSLKEEDEHTLTVSWTACEGVDGYRLYRKPIGGSYGNYLAKVNETGSGLDAVYEDPEVNMGVIYYYRVRAYVKTDQYGTVYSDYCTAIKGNTTPVKVKTLSLTSARYDRLQVSWQPVEGMTGYFVESIDENGKRKTLADVKGDQSSYLIKGLTCGTKYNIAVRGYVTYGDKTVHGKEDSKGLTAKPIPTKPTASFSSTSSGEVSVSWNKIAGATGYLIYYKTSEDGSKKVAKKQLADVSRKATVTGLNGKYCYYAVRSYRVVGDKTIYSNYDWVKVKVKK